jgi:hypothetical protein
MTRLLWYLPFVTWLAFICGLIVGRQLTFARQDCDTRLVLISGALSRCAEHLDTLRRDCGREP